MLHIVNMKKFIFIIFIILLSSLFLFFNTEEINLPPGILISDAPTQEDIKIKIIREDIDYIITAIASYDIKARVLAKKQYSDKPSDISSTDLALGWQKMSSNELLKTIKITQNNRFYFWYTKEPNYPRRDIETQSANTHIIAADKNVELQLKKLNIGSIVHMKGYLVNVKSKKDKFIWNSSTTRDDTGKGACEIIYVKSIEVN